jgi:hypothetical protein
MTGLEIAGIIVGSVIGYMIGIGVSHKIIYDHSKLCSDDALIASIFVWYLVMPVVAARAICNWIPKKLEEGRLKKKKAKELPPIHIKKGAKVATMQEYKELKQLCMDFEIEFAASQEVNKLLMDI